MDPLQNSYSNDGQYFTDESFNNGQGYNYNSQGYDSSNMAAYLNGVTQAPNVFEGDYANDFAMQQGQYNNNNFMDTFDMNMNGLPQNDFGGMTFNPQLFFGSKGREHSNSSTDSNPQASASPQNLPMRSLPMSSNGSDTTGAANSPNDHREESTNSAKRNRFLERNRLAAAKCRTKKKEWTNNLEAAARQASQQTRELHAIVQNLRNEVQEHKAMLQSHQGCQCHPIHEYLSHHGNNGNNMRE